MARTAPLILSTVVLLASLQLANFAAVAINTEQSHERRGGHGGGHGGGIGGGGSSSSSGPLVVTTHETQNATTTGIENVEFIKYVTVDSLEDTLAVTDLFFSLPGRAFVDYVDYQDAGELVNSSTLMQIKISGDVFDLVDQVLVWSTDDSEDIAVTMYNSVYLGKPTAPGHLLVEVEVFRANAMRHIQATSLDKRGSDEARTFEVVINEGVVYSGGGDTGSEGSDSDTLDISSFGTTGLYLLTASTPLDLYELNLIASDQSKMYVDGGALTTSSDVSAIANIDDRISHGHSELVAFFDSVETDSLQLSGSKWGTICFTVRDLLDTDSDNYIPEPDRVVLPGETDGIDATGTFACSKMQTPERKPRDISLKTVEFTPRTDSDASATPDQSNCASTLRPAVVLCVVAAVVLFGQ